MQTQQLLNVIADKRLAIGKRSQECRNGSSKFLALHTKDYNSNYLEKVEGYKEEISVIHHQDIILVNISKTINDDAAIDKLALNKLITTSRVPLNHQVKVLETSRDTFLKKTGDNIPNADYDRYNKVMEDLPIVKGKLRIYAFLVTEINKS